MHFIQGINKDPVKLQFVQSIQEIAEKTGTLVIAEGIETQAELLLIRDLGIDFGQGYHIARPNGSPARIIPSDVAKALAKSSIAIHPQECIAAPNGQTALRLLQSVPDVEPDTSNNAVYEIFEQDPDLQTVAVVSTGTPVGLITRASMIDRFARVYQRELYGKKPCTSFMDAHPLITDKDTSLQELSGLIVNSDRRHLFNGFIITDQGRFLGVGNSHDLMREITQMQLVAARYANPLTLLPGNVPINEHIDRLLQNRVRFCACYADLDHFKPFNDIHGYRKGDDAIQLTGQLLIENCDPELDFVGHIGGDDFIILFQSEDWEARCQSILQAFETAIAGHYPDDDRARGGYYAEDRQGNRVFHPLVSLSLGAVRVEPEQHSSSHQVASAAAEAKKQAKKTSGNTLFIDRRQALCSAPPAPNESVEPSNKQVVDPYDEKTAT
jgi:diguanylate cyclase (GGDEF)-like protein